MHTRPECFCSVRLFITTILFAFFTLSCSFSFDGPMSKTPPLPPKTSTPAEATDAREGQLAPGSLPDAPDDGRKWTRYMTDDYDVRYFIDEGGILKPSKEVIQFWRKREFPPGSSQRRILTFDEINCRRQEFRTVELQVTYADGRIGKSTEPTRWVKIWANSGEEYLMDEYCK